MTTKKLAISLFITVILTVVIRSILRNNGIHNFFSENSIGGFLIQWGIFLLLLLVFKKKV
ncbi:hypothetical protein [Neobacillus drentensis]|uniref:hypothetical protein n=1 Tax=Neobacillus drentensis TaxID=220684 RepID=UPI00286372E8|nr:hypothetical protein [Neobacillus drentensis]MDR7238147.1 hypothetical protein [Neobacillus drentensis]